MHFYPLCIVERKRPAINLVSARTFLELYWTAKPFVLWAFHIRIKIKGLPHNMLPPPLFGQVACTNKSPNCCQSGAQSKLHLICFLSLLDASLLHGEQSWLQKSSMCVCERLLSAAAGSIVCIFLCAIFSSNVISDLWRGEVLSRLLKGAIILYSRFELCGKMLAVITFL
jgi:hypothetical protein